MDCCDSFFSKTQKFIDRQRNVYGGHVHDEMARYVLSRVEQTDDCPGAIEIKFSDDNSQHYVFKFAESIIDMALFVDRGNRDREEFIRGSFQVLMDAVKHSTHATQILADEYIMPVFGWNP